MANPADILSDPDFVSANAETKQAIFDKHVANDPSFTSANPQTQTAIRTRFGLVPNEGIPGKRGFLSNLGAGAASLADTTVGGVLPMLGQVVQPIVRPFTTPQRAEQIGGAVSSALDKPFGKAFGVTEAPGYKQETSRQLMDFVGQNINKGAGWIADKTGLPVEDVRSMVNWASLAVPGVARAAAETGAPIAQNALTAARNTPIGQAIEAPLVARAAKTQAANVARSYENAPIIDAAQAADRTGLAVNPAITNPTFANKTKGMVIGPAFEDAAAKANAKQTTTLVRNDLGLTSDQPLNASAIDAALNKASKPYDAVRKIPELTPDASVISSMDALRVPELIGDEGASAKVNALVDTAIDEVNKGRSGALVVDDIRQLRKQAQSVYKARDAGTNPAAADIAAADARMGLANSLESLIESNAASLPNFKDINAIREARTRMAQIYDHDRAINYANGTVDPQAYAKMLDERKGNMTGVGADIGKVAATFPEVMTPQTFTAQIMPAVKRSGLGGAAGALLGGAIGNYPGAIAGATIGASTGLMGTRLAARGMTNPAYQAAHAVPTDYRPAPNMLRPAEPNLSRTNALVPYDYSQSVVMPNEMPNWVPGRPEGQVNVGMPQNAPPQLGAPSAESTMNMLRTEQARAGQMSRVLGQQEEARQAAAAAPRQPTGVGVQYDLDPITGKLVPTSAGVKGATPEVWQADTGASLKSATEKIASGQRFDLSAAEKVAWDKTRVDLAAVAPEFKSLTQKQLSEKMMDRQWVADAITKVQDKQRAFDDIAQRAQSADAIRKATIAREQMTDLLTTLEETFRQQRPVSSTAQGPKTRAAQRNQLRPVTIDLNNMNRPNKP